MFSLQKICNNCSFDLLSSTPINSSCNCEDDRRMNILIVQTLPTRQIDEQTNFSVGLSNNTSATPTLSSTSSSTSSSTFVRRKRLISTDFYVSDEEVLRRLEETLKKVQAQLARYERKIHNGSSHSRYYRSRLGDLYDAIADLKYEIRIYQIRVHDYVVQMSTRSGRNLKPVARYQDEVFFSGSNNRHTKGRKIDVGESIER